MGSLLHRHRSRCARASVALLACASVLLPAVPASRADEAHAGVPQATQHAGLVPAEAGHDHCWTAEVDDHQRHDDRRFESQRGLHHHSHAGVAWSSAAPVQRPVQSADAVLPVQERAHSAEAPGSYGHTGHSPRQTRAPPRA